MKRNDEGGIELDDEEVRCLVLRLVSDHLMHSSEMVAEREYLPGLSASTWSRVEEALRAYGELTAAVLRGVEHECDIDTTALLRAVQP